MSAQEWNKSAPRSQDVLDLVDHYFGRHFSKTHALFLAYLLHATRQGHLCVYVDEEKLYPSLGEIDSELIAQAKSLPDLPIVVRHENRWYLKRSFDAEQTFQNHVIRLRDQKVDCIDFQKDPSLNFEQGAAIEHAFSHALTLVCGGPGTGKTYTAATLIRHFPGSVLVAAPTGKAAANLRAALPDCTVKTLHALLYSKLDAELIVIDEGSMIDAEMMAKLFAAIPEGARLVIFGDPNQLPPVEAGSLFTDLAQEGSIVLTKCLRAELQEIIDLCEAVKRAEMIPYKPLPSVEELVTLIRGSSATILTPLRRGLYGAQYLNQLVHQKDEGAPIMITANDTKIDLYNGDVGTLHGDEAHFGQRRVPRYLLPPYTYAYVLSVHKSQGSEYEDVIVLLPEGSERFGKEMLYTAVTRAKKRVTLYAAEGVLEKVLLTQMKRLSHRSMPSELIGKGGKSRPQV